MTIKFTKRDGDHRCSLGHETAWAVVAVHHESGGALVLCPVCENPTVLIRVLDCASIHCRHYWLANGVRCSVEVDRIAQTQEPVKP